MNMRRPTTNKYFPPPSGRYRLFKVGNQSREAVRGSAPADARRFITPPATELNA